MSFIITFNNSKDLQETFKKIPLDKILIETDSPYLCPEPNRGKINEPSQLVHVLKHISLIKNESEKNIAQLTSNNFFKLFNLKLDS